MHNIYILRGNNAELFDYGIYGVFDSKQKALNAAQQLIDILIDNGERDLLRDEGQVYQGYHNGYLSTITLSKLDSNNQIEDEIAVTDVYDHEINENKVESLLYQMDINVDEAKNWQLADSKSVTYTTYFPVKEEE